MKVNDLKSTNQVYKDNINEWRFLLACYEGPKELVRLGYLERNERESIANYKRRLKEAYGFNYSKSVVELFNFYLFNRPVKRDMGPLGNDEAWKEFFNDCNLYGDDYDSFFYDMSRYAGIFGHVGILVDKSSKQYSSRQEEIADEVYPYLAGYFPTNILDWEFKRDENNRPYLAYLKLLDDDGVYRLWWPDKWETWMIPEETTPAVTGPGASEAARSGSAGVTTIISGDDRDAEKIAEGQNPLEEIPFVILYNAKSKMVPIGVSDIHDIGRIDTSILRNLSQGEEIISYAAFPMMRKPMQEAGAPSTTDEVGVTAILEFDPEHPESKPDWLNAEVQAPLSAILEWISKKIAEVYRASNAGGMASTEIQTEARSGVALRSEFQLLNAKLAGKAGHLEHAEKKLLDFWLDWQEQEEMRSEITIERSRQYDVENLATDLQNALTANSLIKSKTFSKQLQKAFVRIMLPSLEIKQYQEIDKEIDEYEPVTPHFLTDDELNAGGGPNTNRENEEEEEEDQDEE
jgi:hypothetical protein